MRGHFIIVAGIALQLASSAAAADPAPICADRPGKASATCTVAAGHLELDIGFADWSLQKNGEERETDLGIGDSEIRYGLTDRDEIAFEATSYLRNRDSGGGKASSHSGFGDLTAIYRHRLTADDAPIELTLVPEVKIPTAKRSLGNGKWEGGLLIPIGYAIPKTPLSLAFTPEIDWVADADGHGHHAAMAQVASLGWQATDKLNLSAEIWGAWDWDPSGTTRQASADAAAAYLLSNSVQLDAGANFGLNRDTPDVELYAGVSKRF